MSSAPERTMLKREKDKKVRTCQMKITKGRLQAEDQVTRKINDPRKVHKREKRLFPSIASKKPTDIKKIMET